jgi:hypothetical protein
MTCAETIAPRLRAPWMPDQTAGGLGSCRIEPSGLSAIDPLLDGRSIRLLWPLRRNG